MSYEIDIDLQAQDDIAELPTTALPALAEAITVLELTLRTTVLGMTEPSYLRTTRAAYDTIAGDYAERFNTELQAKPLGRAPLAAFAELVQAADVGPVADLGCGPGHVTAHLHSLGLTVFGVDLSPTMIALARRAHSGLRFDEGSITALALTDGVLGDEPLHLEEAFGRAVSLDFYWWLPDRVAELLSQAGLVVVARLLREPDETEKGQQDHLLARKPGKSYTRPCGKG